MDLLRPASTGLYCRTLGTQIRLRPANPLRLSCFPRPVACADRKYATNHKLDLPSLDRKWRRIWSEAGTRSAEPPPSSATPEKKCYVLPMFPYPSGLLHLGHLRVYTIADVVARFRSLQGQRVLLPMGWDAFGLPAENAALERAISPAEWTRKNIAKMKEQLDMMNGSWDWSHEIATCDPTFYKHTQALFLMLHEKGLAYQAEAEVNYDPVDKTVLANEQVDADGCSWRSGARVEKRRLKQWFLRISEYRNDLLDHLEVLAENNAWPERVLAQQKNWLGRSRGATIKFPVLAAGHDIHAAIEVFTTRPDTLFGVQYLALSAGHPVVADLASRDPELQAFLDTLPGLPPDSKVGYLLPHLRAINPLAYHEDTPDEAKASIPVYVAPYVLGDYGKGAVMGVPGHDLRDHAFWKEHHYDQPVRIVLAASEDESTTVMANRPFAEYGTMSAGSGSFRGMASLEAGAVLVKMLEAAGLAESTETWRLRDWLISRQRYWGTPIPVIHCDSCGPVPVPREQLPVLLPPIDAHWAERGTGNPLEAAAPEWLNPACPKCGGGNARRDTDTMDTFVDSSWYYARFADPRNPDVPVSNEAARALLPVDLYIGGVEHAVLHLLYARFVYKFLATTPALAGVAPAAGGSAHEPFRRLVTQGMVHGKTYTDPATGRFLKPEEVDLADAARPRSVATGEPVAVSFEKMSKSKHNGVDPTEFIAKHGADATRAHLLFQAPVADVLNWDDEKITGVTRWLERVFGFVQARGAVADAGRQSIETFLEARHGDLPVMAADDLAKWDADTAIWGAVQDAVASVTASYERVYSLNTTVSDLMILSNVIFDHHRSADPLVTGAAASALVALLAPIAPAFAEECWAFLHPGTPSIFSGAVAFPVQDGTTPLMKPRLRPLAIQVNGKLRAVVDMPLPRSGLDGDELQEWIKAGILQADGETAKFGPGGEYDMNLARKVIVVKGGRTVNFVL